MNKILLSAICLSILAIPAFADETMTDSTQQGPAQYYEQQKQGNSQFDRNYPPKTGEVSQSNNDQGQRRQPPKNGQYGRKQGPGHCPPPNNGQFGGPNGQYGRKCPPPPKNGNFESSRSQFYGNGNQGQYPPPPPKESSSNSSTLNNVLKTLTGTSSTSE